MLFSELRSTGPFTPVMCSVRDDKETRFVSCFGEIEAGLFLLPREAPWLDAFRSELRAFPVAGTTIRSTA